MKLKTGLQLRFWHRWLGIIAMLPLVLSAFTGIVLTYKKQLIEVLVSQQGELPAEYQINALMAQFDQVTDLSKQYDTKRIKAPSVQEPYWTITEVNEHHTLLDIETLAPINNNLWLMDGLHFLHKIHVELSAGSVGKWVLFFSSLTAVILTLSGVYLWWAGRKGFRWRFVKITPWSGRKSVALLQFHRHSGIVIAPTLFIILFTAATMMWQKQISPILAPLPTKSIISASAQSDINTPSKALAIALTEIPGGWPTFIRLPDQSQNDALQYYRFRFQLPNEWHPNGRTSVNLYPRTNKIDMTQRSDNVPWQYRLINQLYPLHSGYGMHWLYSLIVLITGWYLLWLSITGGLNYLRRRK